ncbi:chloride channel protein [Actinomycetospora sp.]|uniref:chloride channel protein n=1 Tax=Actinomycetospora sp. TaxID=1872135 RepID=UPI002F4033A2
MTSRSTGSLARTSLLAAVLGSTVGLLSAVYLLVVRWGTDLVWDGHHARLPGPVWLGTAVVCVVGGLLVGLVRRRHDADTPHDLDDTLLALDGVIGDDRASPVPKPTWLLRAAVLGVISLVAGASLGPEAPLLALATGLGQRMARILRTTRAEAASLSAAGALSGMLGGPLGAVALPVERSATPAAAVRLVGPWVVAGVAGFLVFLIVLPPGDGLRFDLPPVSYTSALDVLRVLGWALPAALLGAVVGFVIVVGTIPGRRLAERLLPSTVLRAVVGGAVLAACGVLSPLCLFSGEHEVEELATVTSGLLLLLGLKIVATLACLTSGWFGGQIFPAIFAGMAAGLLVLQLFPSAPVTVVMAAGAGAAATAVLRRPLAATLILAVFLPAPALVPVLVGVGIAAVVANVLGDRLPSPGPH